MLCPAGRPVKTDLWRCRRRLTVRRRRFLVRGAIAGFWICGDYLPRQRIDSDPQLPDQQLGEPGVDGLRGASIRAAVYLGRRGWFHVPSKVSVREQSRTISLLTALFGLSHGLYERGVELGSAVVGEQSVLLLLDVGQLRVAEAFDRSRVHQALDEPSVDLQELVDVAHLGIAPASRARHLHAAELGDQDRLAAVSVPP